MLTRFKIAIFLFYVFTMVMTEPYRPAKKSVPWKRDLFEALRKTLQDVADKIAAVTEDMPKICLEFPCHQNLCAYLGDCTEVSEHHKSNQKGRYFPYMIKNEDWRLPGYKYCRPKKYMNQRQPHGDKGINKLDEACKDHGEDYKKHPDEPNRQKVIDRTLVWKAYNRTKADDASPGEKGAANVVAIAMCVNLQFTTKCNSMY